MEVLGDDDAGEHWSGPRYRQSGHRHLDLDLTDAEGHDDDSAPARSSRAGVARRSLDAVLSSESLGTAGLVVGILALLGPPLLRLQMMFFVPATSPREQMSITANAITAGSVVALVLGIGALLRLRPDPSTLARTVAGASTILGLVLIAVALWFRSQAAALPTSF
jgi:hypothetical protein